jgi:hypothetical protein
MSKPAIALTALACLWAVAVGGCESLGLDKYQEDVIQGTPTNLGSSQKGVDMVAIRNALNGLFNDQNVAGNLVRESGALDGMIDEINRHVRADNTAEMGSKVVSNRGGTLVLPFFGDAVQVDYLVRLGSDSAEKGSKYAGYKIGADQQTVVLFHTGPSNGSDRDLTLYYGRKSGGTVDVWQALLGLDGRGVRLKGWAFKIHLEGQEYFTVVSNSDVYTHSAAGQPKGIFLIRVREMAAAGNGGMSGYLAGYDYQGGAYTVFDELGLADAGRALDASDLERPAAVTADRWSAMIDFVSTIGDPDADGICPLSVDTFNNGFIKSKF